MVKTLAAITIVKELQAIRPIYASYTIYVFVHFVSAEVDVLGSEFDVVQRTPSMSNTVFDL